MGPGPWPHNCLGHGPSQDDFGARACGPWPMECDVWVMGVSYVQRHAPDNYPGSPFAMSQACPVSHRPVLCPRALSYVLQPCPTPRALNKKTLQQ